jgi:hypothetical protein
MRRRKFEVLLLCWLSAGAALGQTTATSQPNDRKAAAEQSESSRRTDLHLVRVKTITAPAEMANSFLGPLVCDNDGNLYFRQSSTDAVHKLNPKAEEVALFQAAPNTDKKIDAVAYFSVALDGDLYQLVMPHEFDRYVFAYKSDGTFKSATKLNPGFVWIPHSLAVFPSGQLLISGSEYDHDRGAAMWPFTGIFAADGSLLKEVKLEDDETLHEMATTGDARISSPQYPHVNRAVDFSQIEMAEDGNAYLMRWTNPAIIYAISPGGETVRRLKIDPGDSGYRPAAMHVHKNRIAVLFNNPETHDKLMRVVDLEAHELATYAEVRANRKAQGGMIGSSFVCYEENPTRFTFFGADDDNKLQLWIVEPR